MQNDGSLVTSQPRAADADPGALPTDHCEPPDVPSAMRGNFPFPFERAGQKTVRLVRLRFARNPAAFHECLQRCEQLAACRKALADAGFQWKLPGGAYVFVPAGLYLTVQEHISEEGLSLGPADVLVSEALESVVRDAIRCLPRRLKISVESSRSSTLEAKEVGVIEMSEQEDLFPIKIERTFIHVKVPSSLRTEPSDGPRTASSTDADPRSLPNPRTCVKSRGKQGNK